MLVHVQYSTVLVAGDARGVVGICPHLADHRGGLTSEAGSSDHASDSKEADTAIGDMIGALRGHERLHGEPTHVTVQGKRGGKRNKIG